MYVNVQYVQYAASGSERSFLAYKYRQGQNRYGTKPMVSIHSQYLMAYEQITHLKMLVD